MSPRLTAACIVWTNRHHSTLFAHRYCSDKSWELRVKICAISANAFTCWHCLNSRPITFVLRNNPGSLYCRTPNTRNIGCCAACTAPSRCSVAWAGKWRYALLRLSRGQRPGEARLELEREALEGLANQLCT